MKRLVWNDLLIWKSRKDHKPLICAVFANVARPGS